MPSARHSQTLRVTSCTREGRPPCCERSTISRKSCVEPLGRSHSFTGTRRSVGSWFGGAVASVMETCSEVSVWVTAVTTKRTSSWMNPPPPAFPMARCILRYAELTYGRSSAPVNRLPCESFNNERTSEVICPAVLYALDPTTGMVFSQRQRLAGGFLFSLSLRNSDGTPALYHSSGSGDFWRYAATPITELMS